MTLHTKHLLFKLVAASVPVVSTLLFGSTGLICAGFLAVAVGYLVYVEPDPEPTYKAQTLFNLVAYTLLGGLISGLLLCL